MCRYERDKSEFSLALIEKAFLKLEGNIEVEPSAQIYMAMI